jgi:hypothetical protein
MNMLESAVIQSNALYPVHGSALLRDPLLNIIAE